MGRVTDFVVKRKFLAAVVVLVVAGAGYWVADAYRFPTPEIQFSSLETCLEQSDYVCVARAAYKAMPFEHAKRRNHQIGMALAFAGDTDLAMSTLRAEREFWRQTRIAGAIIARHIASDSESGIPSVMSQLDSLVQQAISLSQARSYLSQADKSTLDQFRSYVVSFTNESIASGYEEDLLRIDTKANFFALGNILDALRLDDDQEYKSIIARFSSENTRAKALEVMEKRKVNHLKFVGHQVMSVVQKGGTLDEIIRLIRRDMESDKARSPKAFNKRAIRFLTHDIASRKDQVAAKSVSPAIEAIADTVKQAPCRADVYNTLAKMHARLGQLEDALRLINKSLQLDLTLVDSSGLHCLGGGGAYTLALAAAIGQPDAMNSLEKKLSEISAAGKSEIANKAGEHLIFSLRFMSANTPFDIRSKISEISVAFQELDGRTKAGKAELATIGRTQGNADPMLWFKLARSAQRKYATKDTDFPRRLNRPLLEAMTNGREMSEGWLNMVGTSSRS